MKNCDVCTFSIFFSDKGEIFGWGNSEYCQIFRQTDDIQQINRPVYVKKCQSYGKIIDVASAGSYCLMLTGKLINYNCFPKPMYFTKKNLQMKEKCIHGDTES